MSRVQVGPEALAVGLGVLVLGFLAWRGAQVAGKVAGAAVDVATGIATGNNAVTQNQTDASGAKTTAYEGQGVLGTVGAATNSLSGGWLASAGSWLGGTTYDIFNPAPAAVVTDTAPAFTGGASGNW